MNSLSDSRLANLVARTVKRSWIEFADRFQIISRRARLRFEQRDWKGMYADHLERLELYSRAAAETAASVSGALGDRVHDPMVWAGMKAVYSGLIQERPDWELAETFFNSVTRKIFTTVGVDPRIEFVDTDFDSPPASHPGPVYTTFKAGDETGELVRSVLHGARFDHLYPGLDADAELAALRIDERMRRLGHPIEAVEMVDAVFYRGKGAYLVGRIQTADGVVPLVFALVHLEDGVELDAVLLNQTQVSILFSFTRSYFHTEVSDPYPLVDFLSSLMPKKRRAELYISLGYNKHGKTELYRELRHHLNRSSDRFEVAPGTLGLVMVVFTLPGFDVVFKVIKDRFGAPKQITREQVTGRYRLVFRHDRAGRLVDAQEYEHLEFRRSLFDPHLLQVLVEQCSRNVVVDDQSVTIRHCYVERRVTPLDLYLEDCSVVAAEQAVVDFGQSIKDMAASGIFPGDMLLKNFGVTRHGRVVFYDYDELTTLDECNFRTLPSPPSYEDELASEPWFTVGPDDIFPEEFETFLGLQGESRTLFLERHGDLFQAETWQKWQRRLASGEIIEIYPYDNAQRLRPEIHRD